MDQLDRLKNRQLAEEIGWRWIMYDLYQKNPNMDASKAVEALTKWQDAYRNRPEVNRQDSTAYEVFLSIYQVANTIPVFGTGFAIGAELGKHLFLNPALKELKLNDHLQLAYDHMTLHGQNNPQILRVLELEFTAAQGNNQYSSAHDAVFGAPSNSVSIRASLQERIDRSPMLRGLAGIQALIDTTGAIRTDLRQMNDFARGAYANVMEQLEEARKALAKLDQGQRVLLAFALDDYARAKAREMAEKEAAKRQRVLAAANATVFLVSQAIGTVDPELAHDAAVVGNAMIQVADSLVTWSKAVAGLGALDTVFNLSTVAMTGNVVSAVMQVVALFGDSETPDQMILEQIGALRSQVAGLRIEMHDRFDRIDRGLNTVYSSMMDQFTLVNVKLGTIGRDVRAVQRDLAQLQFDLSVFQANMFQFLGDAFRRPLVEMMDRVLGYSERTGRPLPFDLFEEAESLFFMWATEHAFDKAATAPVALIDDATLAAELAKYPLEARLNLTSRVVADRLVLQPHLF